MQYNKIKVVILLKKLCFIAKIICIALCCLISLSLVSCGLLNKEVHGTELLKLSDNQLYEKVYFQILDLVESYPDEETALSQISPECRTVYILNIFDLEIQNGGLCQFFVNSSRSLAPQIEECLKKVNASEHKELFSAFVSNNNIDLAHLESFESDTIDEYIAQTKRYDFESFDDAYIKLTPLQDYIVSYIKANISEF